jgi:hypothetical protein
MKNSNILPHSLVVCGSAAIVLGLLTGPLHAADDPSTDVKAKEGQAPDMEQMMKKMEELAAPAPEHKLLASLAGEWETESRCYMAGPEAPPTVNKGICKGRMILGGRFLQEEFEGDMMGKKFHGVGLTGFDKFNGKYVSTWIDDMGTGIFVSEGTSDASGKVLTLNGKMDDPMTGEKAKPMQLVLRISSPDKRVMEMHDVGLGEKGKMMEITYVRKAGTSAGSITAK